MKFFNQEGINVTKSIENGRTATFESRTAAFDFAFENNSYVYDLHCQEKDEKRPSFWGYAVPK
jgi:hypothetical protein